MASEQHPLDERLVQVTLELLAEQGPEGLSLRRIARRAGVSHGAPLRHFRSSADLLAEVAARGFQQLSEAVEKASAQLAPGIGPMARLAAAGRAYVHSAVANPGLFALMFRPEALDVENESFRRHGTEAFEQVVRHVRAAQDAGWQPGRDTRLLAGCVWAAVHGLATLWAQGALSGPVPDASLDEALAITFELVLGSRPEAPATPDAPEPGGSSP
jgi:AcrR family transcriptional regulator